MDWERTIEFLREFGSKEVLDVEAMRKVGRLTPELENRKLISANMAFMLADALYEGMEDL